MRRLEHPDGKFWSIDDDGTAVRWGQIGTIGQRRDVHASPFKLTELIAKQVALGYVEVVNANDIAATIQEDHRWYRLFDRADGRSIAIAVDGRRCYEWRDGSSDSTEHRGVDFATAKRNATALIEVAIQQGMLLTDKAEPPVGRPGHDAIATAANPALEAQCRAAPDDPAPWSVYADWLMTQNDPRGELAALRAQGKEEAATALFSSLASQLLGDIDDDFSKAAAITSWHHGFAVAARLRLPRESELALDDLTRRFLALPVAVFVEELRFGLAGDHSNNDWGPTIMAVAESPHADRIRVLRFDEFTYVDQEISWTAFGDFSRAWAKLPQLEELRIRSGAGGTLGTLDLPRLKKLVRVSGGLQESEILSITSADWPVLEHLEIWFGRADYQGQGRPDHLLPILSAATLPMLRHLGLCNCEFSLSAIELLLGSPLLRQLRSLDLSGGIIAARELQLLTSNADKLQHLTAIDVSNNYLDAPQLRTLIASLPNVVSTEQRELDQDEDDDEDYRYAALGE